MQSQIAMIVIGLIACIVLFDGWKLRRAHLDIPNLGKFTTGGMAWKSRASQELVRNVTMLGAIVVMIAAPWFLAERSGTPTHWVIIFDLLLVIHGCWLILPKRYAITKDALWVDGFSVRSVLAAATKPYPTPPIMPRSIGLISCDGDEGSAAGALPASSAQK